MSFRRVGWLAALGLYAVLTTSCGQVYRPVVIPISNTPPDSANFHAVFGISANVPYTTGTAMQIDVSGDTELGVASMGINPTHAAILPNNSRVFVASAGSVYSGATDLVTAFFPAGDSATSNGIGAVTTIPLPNVGPSQTSGILSISESLTGVVTMTLSTALINAQVGGQIVISGVAVTGPNPSGYDGSFIITSVSGATIQYMDTLLGLPSGSGGSATIPVPLFCSYQPDYVATTQLTAVYVANYGVEAANNPHCNLSSTDSIFTISPVTNTIVNTMYMPAGSHPVAMVETPNAQNLYVLNQSTSSVTNLSPTDLSTIANIPVGNTPAWGVARPDNLRVYVVTQGDGNLYTISTATNSVIPGSPQSLGGPGANFVLYDTSRNRLYTTNPSTSTVNVFDATTDPPTPLTAGGLSIPQPPKCSPSSCTAAVPVSVAALPDGSRFYVASYATATGACPDSTVSASGCIVPQITVFDAQSLTLKSTVFPILSPVTSSTGTTSPFAVAPVAFCAPVFPSPWTPASARFRMSATASEDGSRVYASICDSGSVAVVSTQASSIATGQNNTPDTFVTDLVAPFGAGLPQSTGEPLPQMPVFLLTGQ